MGPYLGCVIVKPAILQKTNDKDSMYASVQGVSGLRVRAADGDQEVDHEESDLCNAAVTGSSSRRDFRNLHLNRPPIKVNCSHYESVCISVNIWMHLDAI